MDVALNKEWLEADGLGGFASGTAAGIRTRRYHALLLVATTPPTGRYVLVNGFEAVVKTAAGTYALSSQRYQGDVIHPDGVQRIEAFESEPWPHWIFRLEDGTRIEQEIFAIKESPIVCVSWKLLGPKRNVQLEVRPLLSGRDYHSLHRTNAAFNFDAEALPDRVSWQPYAGVPGVSAITNGAYEHQPLWYYNFAYDEECARGLDFEEDLASPGALRFDLGREGAALILTTAAHARATLPARVKPLELLNELRARERSRRKSFATPLDRAADAYIVRRQSDDPANPGKTIIAGYPWFADWGRDTFIALRGLCLSTGRLNDAREILTEWARAVSQGMLPNRFPDHGAEPEFNAVDASLWFIIAAHEFLHAAHNHAAPRQIPPTSRPRLPRGQALNATPISFPRDGGGISPANLAGDQELLTQAIERILDGYQRGTRFGIRQDRDGLLACGVPGVQLTWMDAKVGDWIVTPRIGKPVEVQALWINCLHVASTFSGRWKSEYERALAAFRAQFWNRDTDCLFDVIDCDHIRGRNDSAVRPNQIYAVGGLPLCILPLEQARKVVRKVENDLLTPLGLRSLAAHEPGYTPKYEGGVRSRDGAYHQGTVWPFLAGPFVEAWVRVRETSAAVRREARSRFLNPLLEHLKDAGLGHVSEIADAQAPHSPRGCPFQAWSLGELLRLDRVVLADPDPAPRRRNTRDLVAV